MKPFPYTYHAPRTLDEALHLMATLDNARVLAGGQSLVPMLNFRIAQPDHLIDLGRIAELAVVQDTAGGLQIGAMTTQRVIERSDLVRRRCPLLIDALYHVGHQQTRNRGTIGGSLCHLDPAAELPVAACALDPVLLVASHAGRRKIRFSDFPAGYLTSSLAPNEILIQIDFKPWAEGAGTAFEEFACRPADFAVVSVAAIVELDADHVISQARLAIGGIAAVPLRLSAVESMLTGPSRGFRSDRTRGRRGGGDAIGGRQQQPRGIPSGACRISDATGADQSDPAGPLMSKHRISLIVNGASYDGEVDARVHLADFLRQDLGLTGTHIGCEHGVCGACTILVDGVSVRACLMLAVQADGRRLETIEGVASPDGTLHPIQEALSRHHGLQCGYCTPGVVMTLVELQRECGNEPVTEHDIRRALSGNLCRCTGYQGIVEAALAVLPKIPE